MWHNSDQPEHSGVASIADAVLIVGRKGVRNQIGDFAHGLKAEQGGQLDPQSLAVQSVGVSIGSPSFIAGKLPRTLCVETNRT